ncbi:MAG: glycosyltransferase involved in cell wall biosynthesis, partial [Rickettsiales bacterium]
MKINNAKIMSASDFNPCIIVPIYNHGELFKKCLPEILVHNIPLIIIDDGSDSRTQKILQKIISENPQITLFSLDTNQGKGAAVLCGFEIAAQKGFTNAMQIDADDQHSFSDIPLFLNLAKTNPNCVINGTPIYDYSVPKFRLYGRKITNFWVSLETLSLDIKDAMCGFRVYPIDSVIKICGKNMAKGMAKGMGFDTEIIVRLYWQGLGIVNQPTKVKYPVSGISH